MHSGLAAVGDTHLHWQESGAGDPLVFIHGFTLDSRMWAPQVSALCARYRVIVYDQRGFGRSDMPVVGVPYTHHDDLAGLLDHLAVPNAHIVGLSVGAVFALNLALVHPARVRSLTLLDTSGMDGFAFPPDIQQTFQDVGAAVKAGDLGAAKAVWMRGAWLEHALSNRASASAVREMVADYSGWHWMNANPARPLDPPALERLAEVRVPTLVAVGSNDHPYNHHIAKVLTERIAGATHVVIPDAGHMANMENAEAFNAVLLEFLQRS